MWILKLSMTTLWMAGMLMGWASNGLWHLLALTPVTLVVLEGTSFERRIARYPAELIRRSGPRRGQVAASVGAERVRA